jgi:hypothetical protein
MTEEKDSPTSRGWSAVTVIGANIALAGLFAFFLVRTYYNVFFANLGIDPATIGLTYPMVLQSAIGLLFYIFMTALVVPLVILSGVYAIRHMATSADASFMQLARSTTRQLTKWLPGVLRFTLPLLTAAGLVVLTFLFLVKAQMYAAAVEAGNPVKLRSPVFTTFGIRASPVDVQLAPGVQGSPLSAEIIRRAQAKPGLLYIGRTESSIVFYDSISQRALYVPSSLFIIALINCGADNSSDRRCEGAVG